MHTPRSGYGAPEPQSAAQSLVRVDTFVTHHQARGDLVQARGDLVFQERVEAARITEDLLAERHSEAVDLFAALEGHAVRTTTTPSCVVDEDKDYVFAATPTSKRRLLRRTRHRTVIVELAEAVGFR